MCKGAGGLEGHKLWAMHTVYAMLKVHGTDTIDSQKQNCENVCLVLKQNILLILIIVNGFCVENVWKLPVFT